MSSDYLIEEFKKLAAFDCESYHESGIAAYLRGRLKELGLGVAIDGARERLLAEDPERCETSSNIYGYLKGNTEGEARLFCAHMDTVSPGRGKYVILTNDGRLISDGKTVLGADDVSGIVSILYALKEIKEKNLPHPDIEVLLTVAEEPYCSGSRFIDYSLLSAKTGYVFDLSGKAGRAAISAPSIISLDITVEGRAAHAGFSPEKGVNALNAAAAALAQIRTGRLEDGLTLNFGTIRGGEGKNIVPEKVYIGGEIRSSVHEKALKEADRVREIFENEAQKLGAAADVRVTEHIRAYRLDTAGTAVSRFLRATEAAEKKLHVGTAPTVDRCVETFGGSDANRLNANGIETAVIACGMENCHTTAEYAVIADIELSAETALALMTDPEQT